VALGGYFFHLLHIPLQRFTSPFSKKKLKDMTPSVPLLLPKAVLKTKGGGRGLARGVGVLQICNLTKNIDIKTINRYTAKTLPYLAARNLPAHLQKKAIVWGAFGAIAVRSAMTLVVVYLLNIPGLMLIGGLLLVWIAYKLLNPAKDEDGSHDNASTSFWGAMKTIVIADAVMGLDNVLAVAGASHGSYLLVVLGLLISIPVVIWGIDANLEIS
jgi:YjbE family integral membrane protein